LAFAGAKADVDLIGFCGMTEVMPVTKPLEIELWASFSAACEARTLQLKPVRLIWGLNPSLIVHSHPCRKNKNAVPEGAQMGHPDRVCLVRAFPPLDKDMYVPRMGHPLRFGPSRKRPG